MKLARARSRPAPAPWQPGSTRSSTTRKLRSRNCVRWGTASTRRSCARPASSDALRSLAEAAPIRVRVIADGEGRHAPTVEEAVFFCAREALQNATKHAGARAPVTLSSSVAATALEFEVADDGPGFDPREQSSGFGFASMRDRIAAVGGELEIISAPGQGSRIRGIIPRQPTPLERRDASHSRSRHALRRFSTAETRGWRGAVLDVARLRARAFAVDAEEQPARADRWALARAVTARRPRGGPPAGGRLLGRFAGKRTCARFRYGAGVVAGNGTHPLKRKRASRRTSGRRLPRTTCERVCRPGLDDCNHWTKRARVSRRLGLRLLLFSYAVVSSAWTGRLLARASGCAGDVREVSVGCVGDAAFAARLHGFTSRGPAGTWRSCPGGHAAARVDIDDRCSMAVGAAATAARFGGRRRRDERGDASAGGLCAAAPVAVHFSASSRPSLSSARRHWRLRPARPPQVFERPRGRCAGRG